MVRKAAYAKLATGLQRLTRALGVPASFLRVGATETYSSSTGAVTRTGGETVTVEATLSDASEASITAGLARAGDAVLTVEARLLRTSLGAAFEPRRADPVLVHGVTWSIERVDAVRDGDGAAVVFSLLLRV